MSSCKFDINFGQVHGNGNVVEATRDINNDFNEIRVSRGLDLYIVQGNSASLKIEADENLHEIITTEVKNGVLNITSEENIGKASAKKILVSVTEIERISASSGSDVFSENILKAEELEISSSSGSDVDVKVNTQDLILESSSGSDIRIAGKTVLLSARASSGSDIKAGNLEAEEASVKASSGSDITVNTSKKLTAKASSGGDIKYYGDPEILETNDGVSGSIRGKKRS